MKSELTVGESDNLAGALGLSHSPDVLYRIGLALAGLSAEVVGEVSVLGGVWGAGGDPLKTEAGESDVCMGDGVEDELCIVEAALEEGEAGEGGGEESHGEETPTRAETLYFIPAGDALSVWIPFREKRFRNSRPLTKAPAAHMPRN